MAAAESVWNYLAAKDILAPADFIIGFGHFDRRIPAHCASLYKESKAPKIVFTGGVGSGSASLTKAEAEFFRDEAIKLGVPEADIIVESNSTNTPENVKNSVAVLDGLGYSEACSSSFIMVATPYRQRRVRLTCRKHLPNATLFSSPPESSYAADLVLFNAEGEHLEHLLVGELERIQKYGEKGDIASEDIPLAILQASKETVQPK